MKILCGLFAFFLNFTPAWAQLKSPLVDEAKLFSKSEGEILEVSLQQLRSAHDLWLVVWTAPSLEGRSIEEVSVEHFKKWKIGAAGKDNGLLLVIAPKERKMRLEVGYGLEGDLPDVLSGRLLDQILRPSLRNGRAYDGVTQFIKELPVAMQQEKEETAIAQKKWLESLIPFRPKVVDVDGDFKSEELVVSLASILRGLSEPGVEGWIYLRRNSKPGLPLAALDWGTPLPTAPLKENEKRVVLLIAEENSEAQILHQGNFGLNDMEWKAIEDDFRKNLGRFPIINLISINLQKIERAERESKYKLMREKAARPSEEMLTFLKIWPYLDSLLVFFGMLWALRKLKQSALGDVAIIKFMNFDKHQADMLIYESEKNIHTDMKRLFVVILVIVICRLFGVTVSGVGMIDILLFAGVGVPAFSFWQQNRLRDSILMLNPKPEDVSQLIKFFKVHSQSISSKFARFLGSALRPGGSSSRSSSSGSRSSSSSSRSSSSSSSSHSGGGRSGGGGASSSW